VRGTWEAADFHARHRGPRVYGRSSPPSRRAKRLGTKALISMTTAGPEKSAL
jgi:hypothetical protein